ncbi:glycosyl hydrolase family 8 [Oceanithermus sp.]
MNWRFFFLLLLLAGCAGAAPTLEPRRPFPQHVVYPGQQIRPSRSQGQLDADVLAYYHVWKERYLVEAGRDAAGRPLYRVILSLKKPEKTVSEGMGYGMMIVAYLAGADPAARELFDGLYRYVRAHPSDIDPRLMGWIQPPDGSGNDSAFDGDADIAYALLLADRQWGSLGEVDYAAAARERLAAIAASTTGPDSRLPLLGDWVDPQGSRYNQYTPRVSDFMPAHFRAFGDFSGDPLWGAVNAAIESAVAGLEDDYSPATGLMPDFAEPQSTGFPLRPADPDFLEGPHDGDYYYNAGRYPWRAGTAVLLYGDAFWRERMAKLSHWAEQASGGDPLRLSAGYHLDGTPIAGQDYFTTFFAAPLATAAMTQPDQQAWLDALYEVVHDRHEDYYEDSVTLLNLLLISNNYWAP